MKNALFRNKKTGAIVDMVPLSQIRDYEEYIDPVDQDSVDQIMADIVDSKVNVDTIEKMSAAIDYIVAKKQYLVINGTMVDLFSASAMKSLKDNLSPANREKYLNMALESVPMAGGLAFEMIKKLSKKSGGA